MVLAVQAAEVTACTGDGEACRAGMEMIKWLFLHGVNGQCTGLGINLADQDALMVAPATANAGLAVRYTTMMRTELTDDNSILQPLVIAAFVGCFHVLFIQSRSISVA